MCHPFALIRYMYQHRAYVDHERFNPPARPSEASDLEPNKGLPVAFLARHKQEFSFVSVLSPASLRVTQPELKMVLSEGAEYLPT